MAQKEALVEEKDQLVKELQDKLASHQENDELKKVNI